MMTWQERLEEIVADVTVTCICQQANVPAENGCALCEGAYIRTVQVRRDGKVRISRGVYDWTPWRKP